MRILSAPISRRITTKGALLLGAGALAALGHAVLPVTRQALLIGAVALGVAGVIAVILRRYECDDAPEPLRSLVTLSDRLQRVERLPEPAAGATIRSVKSAAALRDLADRTRRPVFHNFDPGTGRHEFLLLTVGEDGFRWNPPATWAEDGLARETVGAGRWR